MLKYLGILLLVLMTACNKNRDTELTEAPVMKKVEFHVHAGQLYTEPAYTDVAAEVKLSIYKINYRTGQNQLLWEQVYDRRPLSSYPHLPQKFLIEKEFNVLESKEKLQAQYTINYFTPQGPTAEIRAEELVPGVQFAFLDVDV